MKAMCNEWSIEQVNFGGGDDPEGRLTPGREYEIVHVDVHRSYTELHMIDDKGVVGAFNSVFFDWERGKVLG